MGTAHCRAEMTETPTLSREQLRSLAPEQLHALVEQLQQQRELDARQRERDAQELAFRSAKIDKLTFEVAQLRRMQFGQRSERMNAEQRALFEESVAADIAAAEQQLTELAPAPAGEAVERKVPKRAALPEHLPRRQVQHEPQDTRCRCGCQLQRVGEDVTEKLDYTPGVFTVERHVRGKWACAQCQTLVQAPVPAAVIDKGLPTAGLLAQVLVAKHNDHLPLYRQEAIFARAGLAIPRSTLASWVGQCGQQLLPLAQALKEHLLQCEVLHADETPVAVLAPGTGKTHRAYLWAYAAAKSQAIKAVVYDFTEGRSGENARNFLGHGASRPQHDPPPWRGHLVCDDFSGYKALFGLGVVEAGCMAHARRKFVELHQASKSQIAGQAVELIAQLYAVEAQLRDADMTTRLRVRQERSAPVAQALHAWLQAQRARVTDGTATAKALDYSLQRWDALTRFLQVPELPIDNNHDEQQIRPWATGRKNWLFAGTMAAGKRAAAIMSLLQSAKLNGLDPYVYLKDVLERLPTQRASQVDELLPHRWCARAATLAG